MYAPDTAPVTLQEHTVKLLACIIAYAAVLTNLTVLTAQLRTPSLRRAPLHWLICTMQTFDLVLMVAAASDLTYQLVHNITPSADAQLCTVQGAFLIFSGVSSWTCIAAIAHNRYMLVVKGTRWKTSTYVGILIVSVLCSITSTVLEATQETIIWEGTGRIVCLPRWSARNAATVWASTATVLTVLVSCLICLYCYLSIYRLVTKVRAEVRSGTGMEQRGGDDQDLLVVKRLCILTVMQQCLWVILITSVIYSLA